ncbi:hypothetical protein NQZ68_013393 [Dissostichus eleginoides]|nr:hypothetical protein NQZ68_013393 [Dissostichus eleginoides]
MSVVFVHRASDGLNQSFKADPAATEVKPAYVPLSRTLDLCKDEKKEEAVKRAFIKTLQTLDIINGEESETPSAGPASRSDSGLPWRGKLFE